MAEMEKTMTFFSLTKKSQKELALPALLSASLPEGFAEALPWLVAFNGTLQQHAQEKQQNCKEYLLYKSLKSVADNLIKQKPPDKARCSQVQGGRPGIGAVLAIPGSTMNRLLCFRDSAAGGGAATPC